MAKAKKVSPRPPKRPTWTLYDGVGFDTTPCEHGSIKSHFVVVISHPTMGLEIVGPFVDNKSAKRWIADRAESAMYENYDSALESGVSFNIKWMDIPRVWSNE